MILMVNISAKFFFGQKVDGPGFALGGTLLGTHKVQKCNLHLTQQFRVLTTWKEKKVSPSLNDN